MKKFDFIPLALLSVLCCSCNDDYEDCNDDYERRIVKDGESSVEDNVEVLENSTKEIVFLLSEEQKIDVNDKEIILSVNNLGDKSVEIKAPEFIYPQKWGALRVEAQEAAQEN